MNLSTIYSNDNAAMADAAHMQLSVNAMRWVGEYSESLGETETTLVELSTGLVAYVQDVLGDNPAIVVTASTPVDNEFTLTVKIGKVSVDTVISEVGTDV